MTKDRRGKGKRAALTPREDYCWVHAFCFYVDEGYADLQADRLAWRDMCDEFPRLIGYSGCNALAN